MCDLRGAPRPPSCWLRPGVDGDVPVAGMASQTCLPSAPTSAARWLPQGPVGAGSTARAAGGAAKPNAGPAGSWPTSAMDSQLESAEVVKEKTHTHTHTPGTHACLSKISQVYCVPHDLITLTRNLLSRTVAGRVSSPVAPRPPWVTPQPFPLSPGPSKVLGKWGLPGVGMDGVTGSCRGELAGNVLPAHGPSASLGDLVPRK